MRKTMQWLSKALTTAFMVGLLLGLTPTAASAQQVRQRVVVIERVPVIDPFFPYPYPYAPYYVVARNYGYVKLDTHLKDASVFVDGGYADKIKKNKKFALRPGNHDIELRDSDGRSLFQERVAVIVGRTTKVEVPS
jgi:hypothetical protein